MVHLGYILWIASLGISQTEIPLHTALNAPAAVLEQFQNGDVAKDYALNTRMNPFYLRGDFNGDGRSDYAVLIRHRESNKEGTLILHGGTSETTVLGAGNRFSVVDYSPDDFKPLDYWKVMTPNELGDRIQRGEGILIGIAEVMSVVIYQKENEYTFDRLGD